MKLADRDTWGHFGALLEQGDGDRGADGSCRCNEIAGMIILTGW